MFRRRLLSIVGALGLVTGLLSSGVAAQADTPMSDSAFQAMVNSYTSLANYASTFCYARPANTTPPCPPAITQSSTQSDNVAICVERDNTSAPTQFCEITQTNTTRHNIAIVIQIVSRNGNDSDQNATQDGRIHQFNTSGTNFAAVVQFVKQTTGATVSQNQTVNQGATIEQTAATGHNLAILGESSKQSGYSQVSALQTQFSNEDANTFPHHINQTSTGRSVAFATQNQIQELSGSGMQSQTIDPRCCSIQQSNTDDIFHIQQFTSQRNNHQPTSSQNATSVAKCDTSGNCTTSSTTNQNGTTTTLNCGPSPMCTTILVCDGSITCPIQTTSTCPDGCPPLPPALCFPGINCESAPVSIASFGNRALAIAPRSQAKLLARSASSVALLT